MLARAKAALQKMNRQNSSVRDSSYDGLGLTREDLLAAHSLELLEMAVLAAQQKTGAGGAALALVQGTSMICRASAGAIAPPLDPSAHHPAPIPFEPRQSVHQSVRGPDRVSCLFR